MATIKIPRKPKSEHVYCAECERNEKIPGQSHVCPNVPLDIFDHIPDGPSSEEIFRQKMHGILLGVVRLENRLEEARTKLLGKNRL